jgi:AcrR family transcriptional regulator
MKNGATERQKEIIEVSLQLMDESGIQSLTIKNLAKRIGFAESAVYRHYENKIQILLAILEHFQENTEYFFTSQVSASENALLSIEKIFSNHFNKFAASPSLVSVIFSEEVFRNELALKEKVKEIIGKTTASLSLIVVEGQKRGEIREDIDAHSLTTIILGSLRMFVKQWHMSGNAFDLISRGQSLTTSVVTLLKKND